MEKISQVYTDDLPYDISEYSDEEIFYSAEELKK